jgi:hypothetical protein
MKLKKASVSKTALFVRIIVSLSLVFAFTHQSLAATIYVDDDCLETRDGTEDYPYCKIQDGINHVPTPDVVEVKDGMYNECITMKSDVTVGSSVGYTPTINCNTDDVSTVTFNGAITCDLHGFNITHSTDFGAGVHLDGTSGTVTTTISNCNIYDIANSAGIRMNGAIGSVGSPTIIEDNTIYDCLRSGIAVGQADAPLPADVVSGGSSITVQGNTIGDNTDPNGAAGIYLKGSGSVTVVIGGAGDDKNTIAYNPESGMRLDTITDLTINNNKINNNTKAGILLIDVGEDGNNAVVQNNTIEWSGKAGINIGGASYLTVGPNNNISYNSTNGIAFNMGNVDYSAGLPSSGPVTITGNNDIDHNTYGGIGVMDAIANTVIITQNGIDSNNRGGIGIQNSCTLEITKNTVSNNIRGGIKTGDDSVDPGGFSGTPGAANLTIEQNKVYGNGASGIGGGIDVRHADGTVKNNLVYENHRGGIRFGDWIDAIINNTVADNGDDVADRGGGIIYDNINIDPPEGVNDPPAGNPPETFDIRNNICAYNQKAGIRGGCTDNTVYNLLYGNFGFADTDCGADENHRPTSGSACVFRQLGGFCWPLPSGVIFANPLFADNYSLGPGSPAIDAGDPNPAYKDTDASRNDMGAYGGPDPLPYP